MQVAHRAAFVSVVVLHDQLTLILLSFRFVWDLESIPFLEVVFCVFDARERRAELLFQRPELY